MAQKLDLTGRRFGRLVALAPTPRRTDGGSVVWQCRCDCGRETEVSARRLSRGKVRSCGCLSRSSPRDYIGARFGRLTVLSYAGTAKDLDKTSKANFWRCQCDCGNQVVVSQTELLDGDTRSCGCLQKERARETMRLVDNTSVAILERVHDHPPRKDNTSGHTGVLQRKNGRWQAYISFQKKRYYLGDYASKEEAIKAREQGEALHADFLAWYYAQHPKTCTPGST